MITATHSINLSMFREVYADAVCDGMPTPQDYKNRSLHWHGPRVSLAEAAELYYEILNYNEFQPSRIAKLAAEFADSGIEVTPARESSVAIYLYIPDELQDRVKVFVEEHLNADEIDWKTEFACLQDGEAEMEGLALRIWWD